MLFYILQKKEHFKRIYVFLDATQSDADVDYVSLTSQSLDGHNLCPYMLTATVGRPTYTPSALIGAGLLDPRQRDPVPIV